ncbi:helix-turn-helix domain-containing protein [Streptomyces sp. NPDC004296]|uniref:helix-turn-helix domain-containing protein n=1 Tax=Streptomyces sp. NPDC004296 TaxID=3364697 RepID=UPI0036B5977F
MLDEMVFRSEDVPAADRLAFWAERMGNTHAPVRLRSDHAHDFRASQRVLALGAVSVWPATFQQVVIRRTPQLIRRSDPELCHLSLASYLHRLFQREEATVAAWIRRRRLEAARRDLADPALRTLPVHAIATRWGFSRAADFSRAFRTAYGTPPRDYRSQAASS